MSWLRFDDGLDEHGKVEQLLDQDELRGLAAIGLLTLTATNCSRRLTDGQVTVRTIKKLAPEHGMELVERLLDAGLYDEGPDDDGAAFAIHDYLDYNPSKEDVLERRRQEAERKAVARRKAAERRRAEQESDRPSKRTGSGTPDHVPPDVRPDSQADGRSDVRAESRGLSALPVPSRPDPSPTEAPQPPEGGRKRDQATFDRAMAEYAAEHFPGVEVGKVKALADRLRAAGETPTVDALREYGEANPIWALQPAAA